MLRANSVQNMEAKHEVQVLTFVQELLHDLLAVDLGQCASVRAATEALGSGFCPESLLENESSVAYPKGRFLVGAKF